MSESDAPGVLYTEHTRLKAMTPLASLWSFESCRRGAGRRPVAVNPGGSHEYWLDRSDPLLNTFLPGTGVSLIVNFGDPWAVGRTRTTSRLLPSICVAGPVTRALILTTGRSVRAVGAVFTPTLTADLLGMPASELVDRIVPLEDVWSRDAAERLAAWLSPLQTSGRVAALRDVLVGRIGRAQNRDRTGELAALVIARQGGRGSIDHLARRHGLTRQQFARRFSATAGLPPKLFARITRFQALVRTLLSTNVSQWASVSSAVGFYDQAHMINEFRELAGSPPTVFFRPHGVTNEPARTRLRGRPSEWSTVA
jgi:AraC-like DNA-binding protein